MTAARWAPVPGWERHYEVSDAGEVRSVPRILSDGRAVGGVPLAGTADRDGYLRVTLRAAGFAWTVPVHLLVKLAFTGPRRGREVRHLNDDPADNRLVNLRYGTRRQNEQDKRRNRSRRDRQGNNRTGVIGEIGNSLLPVDGCYPERGAR
jgi:hypothetical protein